MQKIASYELQHKRCQTCGFAVRFVLRHIPDPVLAAAVRRILQTDFDQRIVADAAYRERVLSLKDKRLGCVCRRPGTTPPCHGDVLVRWLEHQPTPEQATKVKLMAGLLTRKFADPALRQKLLATGDAKLVEGNWWGDRFWGIDLKTGEGQNTLGRLLMTLRIRLREEPPPSPTAPTVTRPLVKIISGGQTGADQAGLQVAEAFGIPTGGWAPKGWITSRGPNPNLLRDRFKLQEHPGGYPARTFANAKESDGTIRLAHDFTTAGERCTLNGIREAGRPHFDVDLAHPRPAEEAVAWIREHGIRILNVALSVDSAQRHQIGISPCHRAAWTTPRRWKRQVESGEVFTVLISLIPPISRTPSGRPFRLGATPTRLPVSPEEWRKRSMDRSRTRYSERSIHSWTIVSARSREGSWSGIAQLHDRPPNCTVRCGLPPVICTVSRHQSSRSPAASLLSQSYPPPSGEPQRGPGAVGILGWRSR